MQASLPVLITAQKGLGDPRYPSVQSLMQAKKKEIKVIKLADLGLSAEQELIEFTHFELPAPKKVGKKIDAANPEKAAQELVQYLKDEAKVI